MSYSEKDGNITLTMSMDNYQSILLALGIATGWASKEGLDIGPYLELINRINEGNQNFIPYQVKEKV